MGSSRSFAENHNDFALVLYDQVRQSPGNLLFSPFSIRTALAMTYAGAKGHTAVQMREALRFGSLDDALHSAFAEIIHRLNTADWGKFEIAVENSLWGQDGTPLETRFLDVIARYYGGGLNRVDFGRDAAAARVRINQWVEDKTTRRIRELIPPEGVDAETRLLLVNAVYFKGAWALRFREASTRVAPLHLEGGGIVQASLMYQRTEARYLQTRAFQAVDLDYDGGELSLLVFLPHTRDGLRDLEMRLSVRVLHDCLAKMNWGELDLFLPRFRMTWGTFDFTAQLRALGMPLAFARSQADFSGINGRKAPHEDALFISAVFHQARVEVNEEGTQAAAATAVGMPPTAGEGHQPRVPIFRADHPFLFAIRERESGAILFLGRMVDPTRES